MQWIHLRFAAPIASFGGETIDAHGVIRTMPALSMVTGLLANALGWTRSMRTQHQRLQDRIVFGVAWESAQAPREHLIDYQTAEISPKDKAWTTTGRAVGRRGDRKHETVTVQRWQHYYCDVNLTLVIRLLAPSTLPTLDELAIALEKPARPLFIGRKSCLPSDFIYRGKLDGFPTALSALRVSVPNDEVELLAYWPGNEMKEEATRILTITDQRDWFSRLHGGARQVCEGRIDPIS